MFVLTSSEAHMKTAIAFGLLLLAFSPTVHAGVQYPGAITFGPAYAIADAEGFPYPFNPEYGSPLMVAGLVTSVGAPFNDLLPTGPYEVTFIIAGPTFSDYGVWDDFSCGRSGTDYSYGGGTVSFYLDTTPDADFTNPSTFQDGQLVLSASMNSIHITNDDPDGFCLLENHPDAYMSFAFTGGSWFHRVSGGVVCFGNGEIPGSYPDMIPPALRPIGYVLRIDGSINVTGPVATEPSTWGRVKSLYR